VECQPRARLAHPDLGAVAIISSLSDIDILLSTLAERVQAHPSSAA